MAVIAPGSNGGSIAQDDPGQEHLLVVKAASGVTLTAGMIVYVSGYDTYDLAPLVSPAIPSTGAQFMISRVSPNGIADAVRGLVVAFGTTAPPQYGYVGVGTDAGKILDTPVNAANDPCGYFVSKGAFMFTGCNPGLDASQPVS